jgi:hydroxymethylglutaryl-CoA synthase
MSEPISRRNIIVDYRIRMSKCKVCGRMYFPPKSFCDIEGRKSKMECIDHFFDKGKIFSLAAIERPTNRFKHLGRFLSGIIEFDDRIKVPGRITDFVLNKEVNGLDYIGKEVIPRFRRLYADGKEGLIHYSSLVFSLADDYYPYQSYEIFRPNAKGKAGIVSYGVYIPKFRIKNDEEHAIGLGIKERTLPFVDEDTTTFSVEAGKRALIHAGIDGKDVKKCYVGSESSPYRVKPVASTVIQVLGLGEGFEDGYFCGGVDTQFACKAASDKFIDAVSLVNNEIFNGRYVMVIGADNSQAALGDALDYSVGAGGVAFIFGNEDVIATLDGYSSYSSDTGDFWRRDGERYPQHGGRFTGEPAYFKHVITATEKLLEKLKLSPKDVDHVVFHSPNTKFPKRVAEKFGFEPKQYEQGLVARYIGNLYAGSSLAGLAAILDVAKPGERIVMTSYGSGAGSDSYLFTVTDEIEAKRDRVVKVMEQIMSPKKEYVDYYTYRKWKEATI